MTNEPKDKDARNITEPTPERLPLKLYANRYLGKYWLKSFLFSICTIIITSSIGYFVYPDFWLGFFRHMSFGYLFAEINDVAIFFISFMFLGLYIDKYIFPIEKFKNLKLGKVLLTLFVVVLIAILSNLYLFKVYPEIRDKKNAKSRRFSREKYEKTFFKKIEHKNILYSNRDEIKKRYMIVEQGMLKNKVTKEEKRKFNSSGSIDAQQIKVGIDSELTNTTKTDFVVNELVDLELFNILKSFYQWFGKYFLVLQFQHVNRKR